MFNAYDGKCPDCGRKFTLPDLRRMAVGDGWVRRIHAILSSGNQAVVTFDEFNPRVMRPAEPDKYTFGDREHELGAASD